VSRALALFDFDGTLTRGDTFIPFLRAVIGTGALARSAAACSPWLLGYAAGLVGNGIAKERLLTAAIRGRDGDELKRAGEAFARNIIPGLLRDDMMARFRRHRDEGHLCVLVSASLDLYLEPWAREAGFAHAICSRLAFDGAGRATGALQGPNCHGAEKVARIRAWLADKGPIGQSAAYGDTKGDAPMLAMVDEGFWVRKGGLEPAKLPTAP
jgi:phosphatidylglycerophosphatase C